MKAEDLLQAMNDIDTKYVAEAQPWTAPVKKLHHPVWAAAAAVMLCLGLGAGAAVMLHSPAVQPGAEGGVTTELSSSQEAGGAISELDVNLEFAQLTPEEYSEKFITFLNEYQEVAVAPRQPGVRRHLRRRAPDRGGNRGNLGRHPALGRNHLHESHRPLRPGRDAGGGGGQRLHRRAGEPPLTWGRKAPARTLPRGPTSCSL